MEWTLGRSLPEFLIVAFMGVAVLAMLFSALVLPTRGQKAVSLICRLVIWSAALLILLRFTLVSVQREMERRPVAVLVDRSASMTLPASSERSRWEKVQAWLQEKTFWQTLEKDFDLKIFSFASELSPTLLKTLQESGEPAGEETRLSELLAQTYEREKWAGIVLATDGVSTESLWQKAEAWSVSENVPLLALYPSGNQGLKDAAVVSVRAPEIGYYKNQVSFEVDVEVHGLPREDLVVRAISGDRLLAETRVEEEAWKGDLGTVRLSFIPETLGPLGFEVTVTQFPGEVTYDNNRKAAALNVLRDRVRVLHVAGRPDWDVRFLRGYLKKNPNLDLISFFILRSPRDNPEAPQQALSLIPFPYHELFTKELANFDLVIFQNFNFKSYFNEFYLSNLERYVKEGGAFVMLGGDLSFGGGDYRQTALEEILPVLVRDDTLEISTRSFRPRLTSSGKQHPIMGRALQGKALQSLPKLWGFHRTLGVKSGAVTLLEHPTEKQGTRGMPIVSVMQVGQGRSVAIMVDSLWRWVMGGVGSGARAYSQFWDGMYRWLVRDPSFSYLRLQAPRKVVGGTEVEITLQAFTEDYAPRAAVRPKLTLQTPQGKSQEKTFPPTNSAGESTLTLKAPPNGRLELTAFLPGKVEEGHWTEKIVIVEDRNREFSRRGVAAETLKSLAERSGGAALKISKVDEDDLKPFYKNATYRVVGRKERPLWDHPLLLLLLLLTASTEWWYRRRHGAS